MTSTDAWVLPFEAIGRGDVATVGGKGANLGELTRAGFPIPTGFCVTTAAFDAFISSAGNLDALFRPLEAIRAQDVTSVREGARTVRERLEQTPIPPDLANTLLSVWKQSPADWSWAVRSSATAEDLPDASFAGQQDTYLNIRGEEALLDAVRRCWASLFTERAVLYRARQGFGHREVKLSVVVQRMVFPEVSGILFTADPINGHRRTLSIESGFGLGEALVSGRISGDLFRVDKATGTLLEARPGDKAFAIRPRPDGGTWEEPLPDQQRHALSLTEGTVRELALIGQRIEDHYGRPQDIEWCLDRGKIFIVQARPITSLFPLPSPAPEDSGLHAYVSFGHVQMMTDPMTPLAVQVWRLLLPVGRKAVGVEAIPESSSVTTAASRIYLDMTPLLRHPVFRHVLPRLFAVVYPDIRHALGHLSQRMSGGSGQASFRSVGHFVFPILRRLLPTLLWRNPSRIGPEAATFMDAETAKARQRLESVSPGAARLRRARELLSQIFREAFLAVAATIPAGVLAKLLLHRLADTSKSTMEDLAALERGLPGNVTTEMDLAVGDLIDHVRAHPEVMERLRAHPVPSVLNELSTAKGGPAFLELWAAFLNRYGMRGPGEVDLSRPRYRDDPAPLFATLLGALTGQRAPGEHRARHAALTAQAEAAAPRLIERARTGWLGPVRAALVSRLIRLSRAGLGMREHPKFLLVRILAHVREAIIEASRMLVERGSLATVQDAYLFRFEELIAALENPVSPDLRGEARMRGAQWLRDAQRTPPLMMTSEGDIPAVAPRTDLPPGAMSGTAASAGVVEGIARVVRNPGVEILHDGEILVAPHTDPGWTPLFVHAAGLVTEVGGLITHGSVVAREYGIPAVVSVAHATQRIQTGQRIRVDGTRGIVEVLEGERR